MPAAAKLLTIQGSVPLNTATAFVVLFGQGISGAVLLHKITYNFAAVQVGETNTYWAACLTMNPSHYRNPLSQPTMFTNPASYALGADFRHGLALDPSRFYKLRTLDLELHGLLVPKRQILNVYQSLGASVGFKCEILYEDIEANQDDIDAVNRKFGKYRRT